MTDDEIIQKQKDFGQRLRANRNAYGITITSLSVHSGLSTRTIHQMELGLGGKGGWTLRSEIRYLYSLKALAEANFIRRTTSKRYFPPVILSPDTAIFHKYL